jgi:hypothetical protein
MVIPVIQLAVIGVKKTQGRIDHPVFDFQFVYSDGT